MNADDLLSTHAEKHLYNQNKISTPNKSQYGKDIDIGKLVQDTMKNPDNAYSNLPSSYNPNPSRITKYSKEYGGNISTADTPTGSHRVFINLDDPSRSTNFPYVPRKK